MSQITNRSRFVPRTALTAAALLLILASLVPAASADTGRHCIWRIQGTKAPVYLVGSIHEMSPGDYPLPEAIENAVKECQDFWFEFDLRPKAEDLFARKFEAAGQLPKGKQIKDIVNPKTYAAMVKITRNGMDSWQHLHPWAVASLIRHDGYERLSGAWGIDEHIANEALRSGKQVGGVETIDEHVRVFADMQDIEGEVYLLQTLVHADEGPAQFRQTVGLWKAGNIEGLYQAEVPLAKEAPTVYWRLLDRRNARWIPRIEMVAKSGRPSMICVGAAHFGGPHGLLALLRARGYKLEQL
jgi:uncharacterized protein YbaP (TraB family)